MTNKRENVHKRKDGRWECRVIFGYDYNGKAMKKSLYGHTKREVLDKKRDFIKENKIDKDSFCMSVDNGHKYNSKNADMNDIAAMWLESKKDNVSITTYGHYRNILNTHILPALGKIKISSLSSDLLAAYLKKEYKNGYIGKNAGLSEKTIIDMRLILLQIVRFAKDNNYYCNVEKIDFFPKKRCSKTIDVFSRDEQGLIMLALNSEEDRTVYLGVLLGLFCGLRIGEVCGLKWENIDLRDSILEVRGTLIRVPLMDTGGDQKTQVIFKEPKSIASKRKIPISKEIMKRIEKYKGISDAFVLTGSKSFIEPSVLYRKYQRFLKRAGVRVRSFHTLRHTFATNSLEMGFDYESLKEIMGHARVSTTMDVYAHPSMEHKKNLMNRLPEITKI